MSTTCVWACVRRFLSCALNTKRWPFTGSRVWVWETRFHCLSLICLSAKWVHVHTHTFIYAYMLCVCVCDSHMHTQTFSSLHLMSVLADPCQLWLRSCSDVLLWTDSLLLHWTHSSLAAIRGCRSPHQQLNEPRLLEAVGGLAKIKSLSVLSAVNAAII